MSGLFNRPKHTPQPPPLDSVPFTPNLVSGLDIHATIQSHLRLRDRLQACAQGKHGPDLNAETLCFDNRCALGQWLHGPARTQLGKHRGFVDLLEQHHMFHITASNVVALSRTGQAERAQQMAQRQLVAFSNGVLKRLYAMQAWMDRHSQSRQSTPEPNKSALGDT